MGDLKLYGNNKQDVERLTDTVRIFSKDIGVEFGISKSAYVTMKKKKLVRVGEMELLSEEVITEIE